MITTSTLSEPKFRSDKVKSLCSTVISNIRRQHCKQSSVYWITDQQFDFITVMLGIDFNNTKSLGDMSLQYLTKGDPPSYTAPRRTHEYIQPNNDTSHNTNNIDSKTQQHTINDILNNTNKQGKQIQRHNAPQRRVAFQFLNYHASALWEQQDNNKTASDSRGQE